MENTVKEVFKYETKKNLDKFFLRMSKENKIMVDKKKSCDFPMGHFTEVVLE